MGATRRWMRVPKPGMIVTEPVGLAANFSWVDFFAKPDLIIVYLINGQTAHTAQNISFEERCRVEHHPPRTLTSSDIGCTSYVRVIISSDSAQLP